jgi:putative transposase
LGVADGRITPHPLYRQLGANDQARQTTYRALFCAELERSAIDDMRLALTQNQPLGNARFYARIATTMGMRRKARPRGRPRVESDTGGEPVRGQGKLEL